MYSIKLHIRKHSHSSIVCETFKHVRSTRDEKLKNKKFLFAPNTVLVTLCLYFFKSPDFCFYFFLSIFFFVFKTFPALSFYFQQTFFKILNDFIETPFLSFPGHKHIADDEKHFNDKQADKN